jgi:DedD protein
MRGLFDDREVEAEPEQHDTELTLSSTMLLFIFFGLVLICGLCFGLGYAVGHRAQPEPATATQPQADAQTTLVADGSRSKPSATPQSQVTPPAQHAPADSVSADSNPIAESHAAGVADAGAASLAPTPVHSALPAVSLQPSSQGASAGSVKPATSQLALMVQIASVTNPEDADVLVNALRKRGYTVTAHREPVDGLIHVRIGPFTSSDEANKWRQKLLNDGYNAIVQP